MTADQIEQMRELRQAGCSYGSIGAVYGVSRQRIHQLVSGYGPIRGHSRYRLLRNMVLKRDESKCQQCGTTSNLIVHHLDGNNRNNDVANLVTLCNPCHLGLHRDCVVQQRIKVTVGLVTPGAKRPAQQPQNQMSMADLLEHQSRLVTVQGINRQLRAIFMQKGNGGENQETPQKSIGVKGQGGNPSMPAHTKGLSRASQVHIKG
jgi:hypothetical protein